MQKNNVEGAKKHEEGAKKTMLKKDKKQSFKKKNSEQTQMESNSLQISISIFLLRMTGLEPARSPTRT